MLYSPTEFRPPYLLSIYKDVESRDDRVAAAILLPSGAHERNADIRVEIERKSMLVATLTWPEVLTNVRFTLKNFLDGVGVARIDNSHPMVGFFEALRALDPKRHGKRESVARIPLPFPVKPDPKRWICTYEGTSATLLIVCMEGPTSSFADSGSVPLLTATRAPVSANISSISQ